MPRKKAAAAAAVATPVPLRGHKRTLTATTDTPTTTTALSTRASKRLKESVENTPTNVKTTSKKSKYFDGPDSAEEETESAHDDENESGYDDGVATSTEASEPASESEDFDSEEETKPKNKRGSKSKLSTNTSKVVGEDLWREGVKTGLGPGKQVFIAKPKPRSDGGTKYVPDKIHSNTMEFLADLKKNNDREWLKRHDPDYRQSWKDWESFVEALTEKIAEIDETIPELPPKDLVFRIYRDVRFSSDPTPYKPHFSAAWSRTGRKGPYAAYYMQIQPGGKSFIGGGLWHPGAEHLASLRRNIDRRPESLQEVLLNDSIRKQFFGGITKDQKKAIKAFCNQNTENALKTRPKGYDADHPNIDLLRLRNYTIGKRLNDVEILGPKLMSTVTDLIHAMCPFVTYLNSIVMPDAGDHDSDDEDEHETGDEDGTVT